MSELKEKIAKLKAGAVKQLTDIGVKNLDHDLLDDLAGRMRLIINNRDALAVSGTDKAELETVRKNFLVKKLGFDDKEKGAAVVRKIADQMKSIRMKNRVAFYYLVQKEVS